MNRIAFVLKAILFITVIVFILKAVVAYTLIDRISSIIFASILLFIFLYMLFVIPNVIILDKHFLILKRIFGEKRIPYSTIKEVKPYNEVQNDIRHFGSNGFLGYIGIMESTQYGKYYSYVKNSSQQIFIITSDKNYLISCSDRDHFINELSKKISVR